MTAKDRYIKAYETKSGMKAGLNERPRPALCSKCSQWTFRALCEAVETFVDPQQLVGDEEAVAALLGRRTYQLHQGDNAYLHPRVEAWIPPWTELPPASDTVIVLAQHVCGTSIGTGKDASITRAASPVDYDPDLPPY